MPRSSILPPPDISPPRHFRSWLATTHHFAQLSSHFGCSISMLLARRRSFLLAGGEEMACLARCVRLKEQVELCSAPDARWIPFTAEERIDARWSGLVWEARRRCRQGLDDEIQHRRLAARRPGRRPAGPRGVERQRGRPHQESPRRAGQAIDTRRRWSRGGC